MGKFKKLYESNVINESIQGVDNDTSLVSFVMKFISQCHLKANELIENHSELKNTDQWIDESIMNSHFAYKGTEYRLGIGVTPELSNVRVYYTLRLNSDPQSLGEGRMSNADEKVTPNQIANKAVKWVAQEVKEHNSK